MVCEPQMMMMIDGLYTYLVCVCASPMRLGPNGREYLSLRSLSMVCEPQMMMMIDGLYTYLVCVCASPMRLGGTKTGLDTAHIVHYMGISLEDVRVVMLGKAVPTLTDAMTCLGLPDCTNKVVSAQKT